MHKELRELWKNAFGDSDAFLDIFQSTAFSKDRCQYLMEDGHIASALYWFDCTLEDKKIAYIYAVATDENHRGKGLCHRLMEQTHNHLKEQGYIGAILSPATEDLIRFYEKIGYEVCTFYKELHFAENNLSSFTTQKLALQKIDKSEFAKLRRNYLPKNAVIQENENLDFLETQVAFYAGKNFLLTAQISDQHLNGIEFLGDETLIPYIINTLSCNSGYLRTYGTEKANGMYYSLTENKQTPSYLGFIFD